MGAGRPAAVRRGAGGWREGAGGAQKGGAAEQTVVHRGVPVPGAAAELQRTVHGVLPCIAVQLLDFGIVSFRGGLVPSSLCVVSLADSVCVCLRA